MKNGALGLVGERMQRQLPTSQERYAPVAVLLHGIGVGAGFVGKADRRDIGLAFVAELVSSEMKRKYW